jgi:allantoinase
LQLGLPVLWTAVSAHDYSLTHLVRWMCSGPARLVGLDNHKGSIAAGFDADIVVWNPERRFIVRPKMLLHRHKLTPYLNQPLRGEVETTFLRGEMIYDRGQFLGAPRGVLLRRGEH